MTRYNLRIPRHPESRTLKTVQWIRKDPNKIANVGGSVPPFDGMPASVMTGNNYNNNNNDDEEEEFILIWNLTMSFGCVVIAAMAAGLTLGMLSIDPLFLAVKMGRGSDVSGCHSNADCPMHSNKNGNSNDVVMTEQEVKEQEYAKTIYPLVKQHHRLLVTLLLLNSIANESLPLFLDNLVPSYIAVFLSVTMVLLFGEILPSAFFTGPEQLKTAALMAPFVRFTMWFFTPIAVPIANILDKVLGHDDELVQYNRTQLAAIVRIMYDEEMKRSQDNIQVGPTEAKLMMSTREAKLKRTLSRQVSTTLHEDEVNIVSGALMLKTKMVCDVDYLQWEQVFKIEEDIILDNEMMLTIFKSGFSRIPVFSKNNDKAVCGVLRTKQLICIDSTEKRLLSDLQLQRPWCVSPRTNMVDLLNIFQRQCSGGKGGHLALVCKIPQEASLALDRNESIPESAGLMGIITLEDVFEEILTEEIYDEFDVVNNTIRSSRAGGEITQNTSVESALESGVDSFRADSDELAPLMEHSQIAYGLDK